MKQLCRKVVIEYRYDSEEEAQKHQNTMKSQGWNIGSKNNYLVKHFRSYYQIMREGSFL